MNKIDKLLNNRLFISYMEKIEAYEADRIFCRHGLEHSLDVARIGYILALENDIPVDKAVIYAAALLHDLGRCEEYGKGRSHHEAGAEIAELILPDAGFSETEILMICEAIACHRDKSGDSANPLRGILYKADKLSRSCFCCDARDECYWSEEQKNKGIIL